MNLSYLRRLPSLIYYAFIHDMVRIYKVLPRKMRLRLGGIFCIQFVYGLLETSTVLVISFFAMSLAASNAAAANPMVKVVFTLIPPLERFAADPRQFVAFACSLVVVFIVAKNLVAYFAFRRTAVFADEVQLYISRETIRRYLNKSYFWHISPSSDDIMQRMYSRDQLTGLLVNLLLLYSYAFCCVALFTSMFWAEPRLTLIVMAVFSLICSGTYIGLRRRLDRSAQENLKSVNQVAATLSGISRGIREILIYRQQPVFLDTLVKTIKDGIPARSFLALSGQAPAWLLEIAGFSTICGVTMYLIFNGAPMPEIIKASTMLMLTCWRALPAVIRVLNYSVVVRGLRPLAMNCLELLETFVREDPDPLPEPDPDFRFERSLRMVDVTFRYPQAPADSLIDINLFMKKGDSVGLVGVSGAGKSTLALVLSGLLAPRSGKIFFDKRELTPSGRAAYIQKVGFVPQSPLLIPGTVADNVAFSQWGRPYDRDKVLEACRMAAMDFVVNDPAGIDRYIGAAGDGLSGGQAQRVSIARALFTDPEVIIFDEATSALDQASENVIKKTISHLKGGITTIIIAHRLTTVENCDVVMWLEGGRLIDCGPPDEVLPRYKKAMGLDDHHESLSETASGAFS